MSTGFARVAGVIFIMNGYGKFSWVLRALGSFDALEF